MKIPKITGIMPVHNVISGHFPFLECILLNLPLLDELIIYDGDSIDGTAEIINELSKRDGRIKLVHTPFKKSKDWKNLDDNFEYCMNEIATGDWIIALHADEFFHPNYHSQILESIYKAHNENINSIRHDMFDSRGWNFNDTYNWYRVRIFRKSNNVKAADGIDSFHFKNQPTNTFPFTRSCLPPEIFLNVTSYHISSIFDIGELVTTKRHVEFYGIDSDPTRVESYNNLKEQFGIDKDDENYDVNTIKWKPSYPINRKVPEIVPEIFHGLIGTTHYRIRNEIIETIGKYKKLKVDYNENIEFMTVPMIQIPINK